MPDHRRMTFGMDAPEVLYVKTTDDAHIAYQVFGEGSFDLVFVSGFASNVEQCGARARGRVGRSRAYHRLRPSRHGALGSHPAGDPADAGSDGRRRAVMDAATSSERHSCSSARTCAPVRRRPRRGFACVLAAARGLYLRLDRLWGDAGDDDLARRTPRSSPSALDVVPPFGGNPAERRSCSSARDLSGDGRGPGPRHHRCCRRPSQREAARRAGGRPLPAIGDQDGGVRSGFTFALAGRVDSTDGAVLFTSTSGVAEIARKWAIAQGGIRCVNIYTRAAVAASWAGFAGARSQSPATASSTASTAPARRCPGRSARMPGRFDVGEWVSHEAGDWLELERPCCGGCHKIGARVAARPAQKTGDRAVRSARSPAGSGLTFKPSTTEGRSQAPPATRASPQTSSRGGERAG